MGTGMLTFCGCGFESRLNGLQRLSEDIPMGVGDFCVCVLSHLAALNVLIGHDGRTCMIPLIAMRNLIFRINLASGVKDVQKGFVQRRVMYI
jgi:hypothetical protein